MQYYLNTLCITKKDLVDGGFLSQTNYENYLKRGKIKTVRRGCRGTDALYDFESLPMDLKTQVSQKVENITLKAQQEPIKKLLVQDYNAINFFATHVLDNGEHLKANTQREYANTAMALNAVIKLLDDGKAWRKALGGNNKGKGSLKTLIEVLNSLKDKYGWKLPSSDRGLRGKIVEYRKNGYASLISGKLCNDNAAKITESDQEAALRRVMANHKNFDNAQVMDFYNMIADAAGWKKITEGTVANKRDEWQIYVDAGARGVQHLVDNHAMQVKRKAPSAPMLYWTIDGWDVELAYQETFIDQDGLSKTTYHNRLTVVVVLDPCNKYPMGYAIGVNETPALIKQAVRNAVKQTKELFGDYYHPYQMQSDRYAIKKLTPFYEALSEVFIPTSKTIKNPKAKVIEPYFKSLNKNHCQLKYNNWTGFGVTSRKENQPNVEILNKIRHSFPDINGCMAQIHDIMSDERASKRNALLTSWELNQSSLAWTKEQFYLNLGETNRRNDTIKLVGSGINLQFNKQIFNYESFDLEFRKHRNVDWVLKFDPEDMTEALAVNEDSSLRFVLTSQHLQPMAIADRVEGDTEALAKIGQFNKKLKQNVLDVQQEDLEILSGLAQTNPLIEETLSKLLIVDSRGNHKDNKSIARLNRQQKRIELKEAEQKQEFEVKVKEIDQSEYIKTTINVDDFI